jgi:hypothetical protein
MINKYFKNLPHSTRAGLLISLMAIPGWVMAVTAIFLFERIFGFKTEISIFQFVIVPTVLTLFGIATSHFQLYKWLRIRPS